MLSSFNLVPLHDAIALPPDIFISASLSVANCMKIMYEWLSNQAVTVGELEDAF